MYKKIQKTKDKKRKKLFKKKEMMGVIKQIAWNTFKNTGDINTFLELVEVENIEKNINRINGEENNGNIQNKWDNNIRK